MPISGPVQEAITGDGVPTEQTFGSEPAQPLSRPTTLLRFLQHRQTMQAGKAKQAVAHSSHTSPALVQILRIGFWKFLYSPLTLTAPIKEVDFA